MHVKSVATAMTSVSWNLLTAAGLGNELFPLLVMSLRLAPPAQHLFHVHFSPWALPGQKIGQDRSLLESLNSYVDSGLRNMTQLWFTVTGTLSVSVTTVTLRAVPGSRANIYVSHLDNQLMISTSLGVLGWSLLFLVCFCFLMKQPSN